MPWPQSHDFQDAVLNPEASFRDEELRACQVVKDQHGLPIPASGQFGIVYQMVHPSGRRWAVKCFTSDVPGRNQRYKKICTRLQNTDLPFMVGFDYMEEGVFIGGAWYPIQVMDWVEGQTLNKFVAERLDQPAILRVLTDTWLKVERGLRDTRITHADLQHGNVMLVPGRKENSVSLKLVDYDGMYLAELAGTQSGESGHPSYQHPRRLAEGLYGPDVDRFSHLVIYTSVKALVAKGRSVWQRYNHGDNLLFTPVDFTAPRQSKALHELWAEGSSDVRALTGRLVLATQQPLEQIPELEQIVSEGVAQPLDERGQREVDRILGISIIAAKPASAPVLPPVAVAAGAPAKGPGRAEVLTARAAPTPVVRRDATPASPLLWLVLGTIAVIVGVSLLLFLAAALVWWMSRLPAAAAVGNAPPVGAVPKNAGGVPPRRVLLDTASDIQKIDALYGNKRHRRYSVALTAGKSYVIDMRQGGNNPLQDPYLILLDAVGLELARDDDSGGNLDARIVYRPQQTGQFSVIATTHFADDFGTYLLTVAEQD